MPYLSKILLYLAMTLLVWLSDISEALSFSSSFVNRKESLQHNELNISSEYNKLSRSHISMLRNFDLPEALIFYGLDSILSPCHSNVRPGLRRLLKEAQNDKIPCIFLSERLTMHQLREKVERCEPTFKELHETKHLHYRSSLEEYIMSPKSQEDSCENHFDTAEFSGQGVGFAPCPAALLDAIHTIRISPKGFGGSAGFGVKHSESIRSPLPQHCVVFVSSSTDNLDGPCHGLRNVDMGGLSRDRCIASRLAGMRCIYIEEEILSCHVEDVCDGIIQSYGTKEDWSMISIDDISTPGSFWLNMAQPKDENGFRVDPKSIIELFVAERKMHMNNIALSSVASAKTNSSTIKEPISEHELENLLRDINSL